MRPEPIHIIILLIVILIIFGAPKLPMIARNIGKSAKIFKSEMKDLRSEDGSDADAGTTTSQQAGQQQAGQQQSIASGSAHDGEHSAAQRSSTPGGGPESSGVADEQPHQR